MTFKQREKIERTKATRGSTRDKERKTESKEERGRNEREKQTE